MILDTPELPQIRLSREEDLLILRLEGEYTRNVAAYVQTHVVQVSDVYGYRLHLVDVTHAGSISPDARRFLLEQRRISKAPSAVAVVGARFAVRTIAHLVMRGMQTLTKTYLGVDFFEDETTARAWIEAQRRRLREEVQAART
jgi:hypothetical protein